jgi:CheY-like chemotaxis protein
VRHLLAAAGLAVAEHRPQVNVATLVSDLVNDYRALRPHQTIGLRLAALPTLAGPAAPSLLLVLQLLLDNAMRRTPGGQAVTIDGESAEPAGWVFCVHDQGASLTGEQLDGLFEDPSLAGPATYGLGLSLARLVVDSLGGRIWAESVPGAGATFSFFLPRPALLRRWTVTRPRVLLIEEDGALMSALRASYVEAGFEVETAASAAAGLELAASFAPSLILLELSAASGDGPANLAALRQCSNAAVICLVAPGHRALVPDALWQGATDCVVKPFHVRELIARTRAILRRQTAARRLPAATILQPGLAQRPKVNPLLQ